MSEAIINSDVSLQAFIGDIRADYQQHKFIRAKWVNGKIRTLDQNSISHAWYEQIARELREDDTLGWKGFSKLTCGVPILRAEDEEFRTTYDSAIKPMSYEKKLEIMKFWPVTSIMKKPQLSKYLEAMQAAFARRDVYLTFPDQCA